MISSGLRAWLGCCVALMLGACSRNSQPVAVGTLERHRFEIAATATEQIVALPVLEGQSVKQGELVAQLDGGSMLATRASVAAQASQLDARLEELRHGARSEEFTQAQAQLAAAQAQHDQADREYQRLVTLLARGLIAQTQVDQQRQLRDTAAAAVRSAQAGLELLQQGTRREQLEQARAALRSASSLLQQQDV